MAQEKIQYYTYNLIDPRDKKVFYVGKGKNKRAYNHERDVIRNPEKYGISEKGQKILDILNSGNKVSVVIVNYHDNEFDAIYDEEMQIMMYGLENLTNVLSRGCVSELRNKTYLDGRVITEAIMSLPDVRLNDLYGVHHGVSLKSIHKEIDEAISAVIGTGFISGYVKGISRAIEAKFSGFFSPLVMPDGYWKPIKEIN